MMRHGLQRYIWCGRSRIGYHWEPLLTTGIGQLVLHQLLYEFLYILITLFVIVYMHVVYRLKVENFRLSSYPQSRDTPVALRRRRLLTCTKA